MPSRLYGASAATAWWGIRHDANPQFQQ